MGKSLKKHTFLVARINTELDNDTKNDTKKIKHGTELPFGLIITLSSLNLNLNYQIITTFFLLLVISIFKEANKDFYSFMLMVS